MAPTPNAAEIEKKFKAAKSAFDAPTKDFAKINQQVDDLKLALLDLLFVPTDDAASKSLLLIQRECVEMSALCAAMLQDTDAFQRAIAQVKHYYSEAGHSSLLTRSERGYMMLGLDLMCMLASNQLAEFHMAVEQLPHDKLTNDPFIKLPVDLEQYLTEGTYNKIFALSSNLPAPYYRPFMEVLLETVRNEIAACMEKSYQSLLCEDAARMLYFKSSPDALGYGKKRGWNLSPDRSRFVFHIEKPVETKSIDALQLSRDNIFYAKQLEMIV